MECTGNIFLYRNVTINSIYSTWKRYKQIERDHELDL